MTRMWTRETVLKTLTLNLAVLAVALVLVAADGYVRAATAASPFSGLVGSWSGSGTLTLKGGAKERVSCRATYNLVGSQSQVRQDLRCASDSYKFEVKGDVTQGSNGSISGQWQETTRNLVGNLTGRANRGRIDARIEGPTFAALLTLTTRGSRQTVSIRSPGSQVEEVLINLRKR